MKRALLIGIALLALSGCDGLASIPYNPEHTPESWLAIQPYVTVKALGSPFVLVQPSSTILVYALGIVAIAAGLRFLRIRGEQQSRRWWGIALLLWGLGALLAGTSYQAFSYEIKCAGRELCSWTSWWEIGYLLLSVASVDAMVAAVAYSCLTGKWRRALISYGAINFVLYALIVLLGLLTLTKFMLSFELLLIFAAPSVLLMFGLGLGRYIRLRDRMDLALVVAWIWLGVTMAGYFLYLTSGMTENLWQGGIWFSENDVLHIGLIGWMIYLGGYVAKRVVDAAPISA